MFLLWLRACGFWLAKIFRVHGPGGVLVFFYFFVLLGLEGKNGVVVVVVVCGKMYTNTVR